jgi:competence protein ComEC
VKSLVVLAALWSYVFITVLSPSVLRAGVMFTFVLAGKLFSKETSVENSLAASAFLLLLVNPNFLFDTGFQLSYLAVAGILIFYNTVYNFFETSNPLLDRCWSLVSLSVAAQATAFPIGLYYFHQFPNYFVPANLLVVPLTTVLTYAGFFYFFVSSIPWLGDWTAEALSLATGIINHIVFFFGDLPFAVTDNIRIPAHGVIFLYITVLFTGMYLSEKRVGSLAAALAGLSLFLFTVITVRQEQHGQKLFSVYHIRRGSAISFVKGNRAYVFSGAGTADSAKISYHVTPHLQLRGAKAPIISPLFRSPESGCAFSFNGKFILIPGNRLEEINSAACHYLILTSSCRIPPRKLFRFISPRYVITDASVSHGAEAAARIYCAGNGIPFYSVREKGAFVIAY